MSGVKRKLIEVALPLEAINRESAREKTIRHGHPATLHLWWARRPLAASRAVLFAQLVDDPSAHPDLYPTEEAQASERQRLFEILERLVAWENLGDEAVLEEARAEILKSTAGNPPPILDPFAGGGSIPLEAQRLGLEANASDLNPVAVLINKALVEIPPKWADRPPVFPGAAEMKMTWPDSTGLAEDVLRYGTWMREEASRRMGHLYPKATLEDGTQATVIAWIWARTVSCPNPACRIQMPLVRSWWLGKKRGKEAYVVPKVTVNNGVRRVEFSIGHQLSGAPVAGSDGTMSRSGAACIACNTSAPLSYIRMEGQSGRLGSQLMAVAAEGSRRRHYLAPTKEHEEAADVPPPDNIPDFELSTHPQYMGTPRYGLTHADDLFTPRQLAALATFSDLVAEVRDRIQDDASMAHIQDPTDYANDLSLYLAFAVNRLADLGNALCRWEPNAECPRQLFARQAISMTWDYGEGNPLGNSSGSWKVLLEGAKRAFSGPAFVSSAVATAKVELADAATRSYAGVLVATDPPYYDNVPYADLSDFFYGWLRRSVGTFFPDILTTVQTPKADELVADSMRLGGKEAAQDFFEQGFSNVFARVRASSMEQFPITVFYAFKQTEADDTGSASTGWQTLLEGMLRSGWEVTGTWPIRTEAVGRMRAHESNALASSVVLALRPRSEHAESTSRRSFVQALRSELPVRLHELQQGSIAPVDLAQAAIGPGMAVFSRYTRVLEADGSDMTVRTALALINQALDEVLAEQEGDFDAETRFAVKWFSQFGWNDAPSGEADVLTRAVNTTVAALERGGIFRAAAGKARLVAPSDMTRSWNPAEDKAISVWEVAVRLGHALLTEGTDHAAVWMRESASRVDLDAVKELAYLMYSVCERKGWAESAMLFNTLGTSWGDVSGVSRAAVPVAVSQGALDFGDDDE